MCRTWMARRPADNHLTGEEWDQRLHWMKVRSGNTCEGRTPWCIAPGGSLEKLTRNQVSIQHRRAQGIGGTDEDEVHSLANTLVLCGTGTTGCHGWVEVGERGAALERGLWVRHDYVDGVLVPVVEYPLVLWSGRRVFLDPTGPFYLPHPNEWGLATASCVEPG